MHYSTKQRRNSVSSCCTLHRQPEATSGVLSAFHVRPALCCMPLFLPVMLQQGCRGCAVALLFFDLPKACEPHSHNSMSKPLCRSHPQWTLVKPQPCFGIRCHQSTDFPFPSNVLFQQQRWRYSNTMSTPVSIMMIMFVTRPASQLGTVRYSRFTASTDQ